MIDRGKLAFIVGTVALGAYGIAGWVYADEWTFGPQGPGTAFFKTFNPFFDANGYTNNLSECAHALLFVAVSLLGSVFVWPINEEGNDEESNDEEGVEQDQPVEPRHGVLEVEE